MRQGRVIRQGCQPMKMVKQRTMTISRQREVELALERAKAEGHAGGDEEVMQGLYALSQTELYTPEPIKDVRLDCSFDYVLFPFCFCLSPAVFFDIGGDETFPFLLGENPKERFRQHRPVRAFHVAGRLGTYPMYVYPTCFLTYLPKLRVN